MSKFSKGYAKGDKRRKSFGHSSNSVGTKIASKLLCPSSKSSKSESGNCSNLHYSNNNSSTDIWAVLVLIMPIIGIIASFLTSSWKVFFYVGLGGAALCFILGSIIALFDN